MSRYLPSPRDARTATTSVKKTVRLTNGALVELSRRRSEELRAKLGPLKIHGNLSRREVCGACASSVNLRGDGNDPNEIVFVTKPDGVLRLGLFPPVPLSPRDRSYRADTDVFQTISRAK